MCSAKGDGISIVEHALFAWVVTHPTSCGSVERRRTWQANRSTQWSPLSDFATIRRSGEIDKLFKIGSQPDGNYSFDSSNNGDRRSSLGKTALVSIPSGVDGSIELILNTKRSQTTNPDVWANYGIDPLSKAILVVKSTNHFYGGFAPIAVGSLVFCFLRS